MCLIQKLTKLRQLRQEKKRVSFASSLATDEAKNADKTDKADKADEAKNADEAPAAEESFNETVAPYQDFIKLLNDMRAEKKMQELKKMREREEWEEKDYQVYLDNQDNQALLRAENELKAQNNNPYLTSAARQAMLDYRRTNRAYRLHRK